MTELKTHKNQRFLASKKNKVFLKTLKDIVEEYKRKDRINFDFTLRQEAIKWIKFIKNGKSSCEDCPLYKKHCKLSCFDFPKWIKHFFNITEEELKE